MASLRKKSNSKFWFACFNLPDGRRSQRSTKTVDKRLAQKLADQFEDAARGSLTESQARRVISDIHKLVSGRALNTQTVRTYLEHWLGARKGTIAPATFREYQTTVEDFLRHLGARATTDLAFVTVPDIAAFRDAEGAKLAVSSANKKLKILKVAFQQAWRDGLIEDNPAVKVQILKTNAGGVERRAFQLEELEKIIAAAEGEWRGMILCGIYTGQRLGDIVRLRWDNIDVGRGTISLNMAKTGRRQIIPLAPTLMRWLRGWEAERGGQLVFPKSHGDLDRASGVGTLSNQFNALLGRCGLVERRSHAAGEAGSGRRGKRKLSELSFHSLRHTVTSLMKNAGISSALVQEFVGHDSRVISQNYTHIDTETLRKAAERLPEFA